MGTKRASGQQTYLNAMALGKLVIVNDAFGVRDYVRHRENGLIVTGSPDSYVEALRWAFDPANASEVERIIAQARDDALQRFNPTQHALMLVAMMQDALAGETPHPSSPYHVNEVNSDAS
jgi:glycosyltransferase involved in cell wall biosynthesis